MTRTLVGALGCAGVAWACSDDASDEGGARGGVGGSGVTAGSSAGGTAGAGGTPNGGGTAGATSPSGGRAPQAGTLGAGGSTSGRGNDGGTATAGRPSGSAGNAGSLGGGPSLGGEANAGGDSNAGGEPSGGSSSGAGGGAGGAPAGKDRDVFGVRELYPSAPSGARWTSEHWDAGSAYDITGRTDNNDPLRLSGKRGTGTLRVTGNGELVMGGEQPRIYVYPSAGGAWRDVEVTVYYRRVADDATAYAGLVVGVRSGADGHTDSTACDAHTYYARLRHDGAIDFEKELEHPASSTRQRIAPATVWPPDGRLPYNQWIGWKFVIYNLSASSVKLESYRDLTEGRDGGDWRKMNETVDDGGWSVESGCAEHSPSNGESDQIITEGGTTFVRNTGVEEARYRWMTIREISPP